MSSTTKKTAKRPLLYGLVGFYKEIISRVSPPFSRGSRLSYDVCCRGVEVFPVNNWICLCSYLCPLVAAVIVAPKKPCAAFFEHSSVKGGVSSDALRSASPILEKATSVTLLRCLKNQSKKVRFMHVRLQRQEQSPLVLRQNRIPGRPKLPSHRIRGSHPNERHPVPNRPYIRHCSNYRNRTAPRSFL